MLVGSTLRWSIECQRHWSDVNITWLSLTRTLRLASQVCLANTGYPSYIHLLSASFAFTALTVLVERQHAASITWMMRLSVVICLERGAACLHMVQLMPLSARNSTTSCLINTGFTFLVLAYTLVVLEKRPLNGCSSSSSICVIYFSFTHTHKYTVRNADLEI